MGDWGTGKNGGGDWGLYTGEGSAGTRNFSRPFGCRALGGNLVASRRSRSVEQIEMATGKIPANTGLSPHIRELNFLPVPTAITRHRR
jgi:hypothetical protein